MAIYGYPAEAEREFISMRTKQGLKTAKASGADISYTALESTIKNEFQNRQTDHE